MELISQLVMRMFGPKRRGLFTAHYYGYQKRRN